MSQTQRTSSVSKEIEEPIVLIDQEEKVDNWFKGILLFAIALLFIFGSIVLLS